MSRKIALPKIDPRTARALLDELRARAPHYTREWPAKDDDDPGVGLLKIFAFLAEGVIHRLNRAPERNFLAFLDMLGIRLLPATSARVPVRFLLAPGTTDEVRVPKGTQVAAPPGEGQSEPIPFETLEEMLAIPAKLSALIAVDPVKDAIYKPPPGFLVRETVASGLPQLTTQAFSAAGTKFLQLEPAGQVQPGDFLRLQASAGRAGARTGCEPTSATNTTNSAGAPEYVVAAAAKGTIITLTEPLQRAYPEQTPVQKLTQFELLAGKDFQAHVLYLGHNKYFEIKSDAQIKLTITLAPGTSANLQALDIAWEFFGIDETQEPKEEKWHAFRVEGEAQGLSRDGVLTLFKPKGEIKETEINGSKSRWIRARLIEAIPATPSPNLPKIESIELKVLVKEEATPGKKNGIPADQAFHNDTPLTLATEFHPFGPEPRLFDRFYIASAEAFSKPEAAVAMNLELDFTDLLAAPTALFHNQKIKVFAQGVAGELVEFQIDPTNPAPAVDHHKTPPKTRLITKSTPTAVVSSDGQNVGVFVRVEGKPDERRIYLRFIPPNEPGQQWNDLPIGSLKDKQLAFDLAAALPANNQWVVYVVADNQVYAGLLNSNGSTVLLNPPDDWKLVGSPGQPTTVSSTPFVLRDEVVPNAPVQVIVFDQMNHTWLFDGASWIDVNKQFSLPEEFLARRPAPQEEPFNPRPYGIILDDGSTTKQVFVFLRNKRDELVIIGAKGLPEDRINLKTPAGVKLDSNPSVSLSGNRIRVFARGNDSRLWEIELAYDKSQTVRWQVNKDWAAHLNPPEANLARDPFALTYKFGTSSPEDFVSVFSTSDKNALLEFRPLQGVIDTGQLQAGPHELLLLENLHNFTAKSYVQITAATPDVGPGLGDGVFEVEKLLLDESVGGTKSIALLKPPLAATSTSATKYKLFTEKVLGPLTLNADAPSPTTITLPNTAAVNDFIFVPAVKQLRRLQSIQSTSGSDTTFLIAGTWLSTLPLPKALDNYVLLKLETSSTPETARGGADKRAILKAGNPPHPITANQRIQITFGPGADPATKLISNYFNTTKQVTLQTPFSDPPPLTGSSYQITVAAVPEGWSTYRDPVQTELRPRLSWEYWNGNGWVLLKINDDATKDFLVPGEIVFELPSNIAKTDVAGQINYWIRARIIGGDYGRELFSFDQDNKLVINKDPIRPPLIKKLTLSYEVTKPQAPQYCLTFNNLTYLDQTAANNTDDKHYFPYLTLPVQQPALYFGFDQEFQGGPVRLYCAARELAVDERNKPKLDWSFTTNNDLQPLPTIDRTDALTKPEFITWVIPGEFQRRQFFGAALYWVRAALAETGAWNELPVLEGVFLNTIEAQQARTVLNEILGSSTATAQQRFRFAQRPVLPNEEVRVREVLTQQEREELSAAADPKVILDVLNQEGGVQETWVRWQEVIEFFGSGPGSRHYRLDRASGEIEFGDNLHGRIPPAGGDNLRVFTYQAGGGTQGNVPAGAINAAVTAVAGVEKVSNPVAAGGGSAEATPEEMMEIGPAQISHRDRAVTPDDFERLAKEASREVRKVHCLPNRNQAGRNEVGWVTLQIVPNSTVAQPQPSLELRRTVQRYLAARADAALVSQEHIFVDAPVYVPVSVHVTLRAKSFDVAGLAQAQAQERLRQFLHPLTGGPASEGWDFGRGLAASDLYLVLEDLNEIDHVEALSLHLGAGETEEAVAGELLAVDANALLASGTHKITIKVANGA